MLGFGTRSTALSMLSGSRIFVCRAGLRGFGVVRVGGFWGGGGGYGIHRASALCLCSFGFLVRFDYTVFGFLIFRETL